MTHLAKALPYSNLEYLDISNNSLKTVGVSCIC